MYLKRDYLLIESVSIKKYKIVSLGIYTPSNVRYLNKKRRDLDCHFMQNDMQAIAIDRFLFKHFSASWLLKTKMLVAFISPFYERMAKNVKHIFEQRNRNR